MLVIGSGVVDVTSGTIDSLGFVLVEIATRVKMQGHSDNMLSNSISFGGLKEAKEVKQRITYIKENASRLVPQGKCGLYLCLCIHIRRGRSRESLGLITKRPNVRDTNRHPPTCIKPLLVVPILRNLIWARPGKNVSLPLGKEFGLKGGVRIGEKGREKGDSGFDTTSSTCDLEDGHV
ncbi:hypothetical protein LIER_34134 [Lithospermum erythrorhizon]|uniref:Uncharacterized protein n=1 Tax=Lithospermum erythrorhizon TaxID=34254 RepID=A0AAV3RYM7_LITER